MIHVTSARLSDVLRIYTSIGPDFSYGCRALLAEFDENVVDIARRYAATLWPPGNVEAGSVPSELPQELGEHWREATSQAMASWDLATRYLQDLAVCLATLETVHNETYPHRSRHWHLEDRGRLVGALNAVSSAVESVWASCSALMAGLRWLIEFTSELCRRPGLDDSEQLCWQRDLVAAFHDQLAHVGWAERRWLEPILRQTRAAVVQAGQFREGYAPPSVAVHDNGAAWATVEAAKRGQCTKFHLRHSIEAPESNIFRIAPIGGADDRDLMVDCTSQGLLAVAAGVWITRRPIIVYGCPPEARDYVTSVLAELSDRPATFADHAEQDQRHRPSNAGGAQLPPPDGLERLPNELWSEIVSHVDVNSVGSLSMVNSELRPAAMMRARKEWSTLSLQLEVMNVRTFLGRYCTPDHWLGRGLLAIAPTNIEVMGMIEELKNGAETLPSLRDRVTNWDDGGWNLSRALQRRLERAYWFFYDRPHVGVRAHRLFPRTPTGRELAGLQREIFTDIKVRLVPEVASRAFTL